MTAASKKQPVKILRAVLVTVFGLSLAVALFLQASSSVLARKSPELAVQLNPLNGLAREQLAITQFMSQVQEQADILPQAQAASPSALLAFEYEALVPKAHAIVAIAAADSAARRPILAAAIETNRRDLFLHGLVFEELAKDGDYDGVLDTLDTILRVHPEQRANFFPILIEALAQPETLPAFQDILKNGAVGWREDFLEAAAGNRAALSNLATLRLSGAGELDPKTDGQIVRGLFELGRLDQSYAVFGAATQSRDNAEQAFGRLDWSSEFPPFDWKYADEGDLRAQISLDGNDLELFVRGGSGGLMAERIIKAPPSGFEIAFMTDLGPQDRDAGVRLHVTCTGSETPLLDVPIDRKDISLAVRNIPANCGFIGLSFHARAWSGGSPIRGTIGQLELRPLR